MNEFQRLVALFGYETGAGTGSPFWKDPDAFSRPSGQGGKALDEAFAEWKYTKRAFTEDEVIQGYWRKIGSHGYDFIVRLHAGGTLTEWNALDGPTNCWPGKWKIVGVALRLNIWDYELDIFANKSGTVHGGIEVRGDSTLPNAYFQCVHEL